MSKKVECTESNTEKSGNTLENEIASENTVPPDETTKPDGATATDRALSNETTERNGVAATKPSLSNETTGRDEVSTKYDILSASENGEPKRKSDKKKTGLSARMEYLARPKKDFMDRVGFERPEGVVPEKSLPAWTVLPLATRLPVSNYPHKVTLTKLGKKVYLPAPSTGMDLRDENNLRPPMRTYNSLHDPHLKGHFNRPKVLKHLKKNGYVSKSGRAVSSPSQVNEYREYTRRILADKVQQNFRDKDEAERKDQERKMKKQDAEEDKKLRNKRAQTNLRAFTKNAVDSIHEGSMESQRQRDRKKLNKEIQMWVNAKLSAQAKEERYKRVYNQHVIDKYKAEEKKRAVELEKARLDVEHLGEICERRAKERADRKLKLDDFWQRKAEAQMKWFEEGLDLEKKWSEDRDSKIASRKTQVLAPRVTRKAPKTKERKETSDVILKKDKKKLSLEENLKENEGAEVPVDRKNDGRKLTISVDFDGTQTMQKLSEEKDDSEDALSSSKSEITVEEILQDKENTHQKEKNAEEKVSVDTKDASATGEIEIFNRNGFKKSSESDKMDQEGRSENTKSDKNIDSDETQSNVEEKETEQKSNLDKPKTEDKSSLDESISDEKLNEKNPPIIDPEDIDDKAAKALKEDLYIRSAKGN